MSRSLKNRLISFICTFLLTVSAGVNADDTEIYFSSPNNTSAAAVRPNVLLILDSSGSMTSIVSGTGKSRMALMKEAMYEILGSMEDVNVGLMRFTYNDGGPVLFPISYIDDPAAKVVSEPDDLTPTYTYTISSGDDDAEENVSTTDVNTGDPVLDISQLIVGGTGTYIQRVQASTDDADEYNGYMYNGSVYVEPGSQNPDATRFTGVTVPQGATINSAYYRLWRRSSYGGSTDLYGHNVDNSPTFTLGWSTDITTRTKTSATVRWDFSNTTPEEVDISPIVQEIVNRAGWSSGNAMSIIIQDGSKSMTFDSYDTDSSIGSSKTPQLEINYTKGGTTVDQLVGLRFTNINIPQGATVKNVTLKLTPTTTVSGASGEQWQVKAENADDTVIFAPDPADISSRPPTTASVKWNVPDTTAGDSVSSPDLTPVVQEVVNRAGWCGGNALTFIISKDSASSALTRYFQSYEGDASVAPTLEVSYDASTAAGCYRDTETAQVSADYDDAEEDNSGKMSLNSSTLDLSTVRVGVRFRGIDVPQGATILNAYLEVNARNTSTSNPNPTVTINGDNVDDSAQFSKSKNDITDRAKTSATVNWPLGSFNSNGKWHQSPDIKTIVQEIINRSGWVSGNSMTFLLGKDNKDRYAESHDDDPNQAARLTITYESTSGTTQVKTVRQRLIEEVNDMSSSDWTPIVETLYEAAHYWRGESVVYGKSHDGLSNTKLSHPGSYCNAPNDCNGADTSGYPPYGVKPKSGYTLASIQGNPNYISPFSSTLTCQANYQVLLTDGEANSNNLTDSSKISFLPSSCTSSGTNSGTFSSDEKCGYDIVKFMHDNDQSSLDNDQTVSTYTVGYNTTSLASATNYLKDLASAGAGQFYEATTASDLVSVFNVILSDVKSDPTSFVAPSLATNAFNRLLSRDEVYFGLFTPGYKRAWPGNVKKYNLCINSGGPDENTSTTSDNCTLGEVLDANRVSAIGTSDNKFLDTSTSVWSDVVDGRATQKGGSGGEINDYTKRIIYTEETGSGIPSAGTSLAFADNPGYQLDATTWDDTGMGGLDYFRAIVCPTPDTTTGSDCESRMLWMLGKIKNPDAKTDTSATTRWSDSDVLHSSPAVITYGGTDDNNNGITGEPADTDGVVSFYFDRLVVGTNDGGLRFINGNTGLEEWEFIPRDVLSLQQTLYTNPDGDHIYGLDVTPTIQVNDVNNNGFIEPTNGDYVHLYMGMRRGGDLIYALDVTPDAKLTNDSKAIPPKFMWRISPASSGFSRLGQTWSPPRLATISISGGNIKKVLIFGGGYDDNLDTGFGTVPTSSNDNLGNAIYIVDPDDGSLIFAISGTGSGADIEAPDMKYSIPTRITILDTNGDGLDDRLYFGDTAGQVWRVDLGDDVALTGSNREGATVVGILAKVSTPGTATEERRFFEPPSVVQVKDTIYSDAANGEFDYVMIGSGNRAGPLDKTVDDRFYAFRDRFIDGMPDGNNDNLADTGTGNYPQDSGPITGSDLIDITSTTLADIAATGSAENTAVRSSAGWYFDFASTGTAGEKVLSASTAIAGGVFFTTYLPEFINPDPCSANVGGGNAYNLHILSAKSVVDWNENGTQDLGDRVKALGGGIPSDVVPVFTKEGVVGIVGVEGGAAQLGKLAGLPRYRTYWYQEQ